MAATSQHSFDPFGSNFHAIDRCTAANGVTIVSGPGSSKSMSLAEARNCLPIDISNSTTSDRCFYVRQVFRYESSFKGHQHLAQSERVPFHLELVSDGSSVKLAGSAATTMTGWRSVQSEVEVAADEWHSAELVFDRDILALFLDHHPAGCYGFNQTSIDIDESQTEVFIGGMIPATRFRGQVADFQISTEIPYDLHVAMSNLRATPQYHTTRKLETSRADHGLDLGSPIDKISRNRRMSSWRQECSNGAIMHHPKCGTFTLHGPLHARYSKLGNISLEKLGHLLSDATSIGKGQVLVFQGGSIYWSWETGAYEVFKPFVDVYEAKGGPVTWGFPIGEETPLNGGSFQKMQRGIFYRKSGEPHAHGVYQDTLSAFVRTGGLAKWGFPNANEKLQILNVAGHKREIHIANFEKGTFYWSEATGTHVVQGAIRDKWHKLGGANMSYIQELGLPTSDETDIPGSRDGRISSFEQGVIIYAPRQDFIQAVYPFKIAIQKIETWPLDGENPDHEIHFNVIINENENTVFCRRYPSDGKSYTARSSLDIDTELPIILKPRTDRKITMTVDVWDSVHDRAHVHLGTWTEDFHAANAWGMLDGRVEFESGKIKGIRNIMAAVVPQYR